MGIVERDAPFLKVKAHTEPGRQRVSEASGRWMAVAVGDGVPLLMVVVVLRQVDFTHPHSQKAEGRRRIQGILCAAVMAAVWVVAAERQSELLSSFLTTVFLSLN